VLVSDLTGRSSTTDDVVVRRAISLILLLTLALSLPLARVTAADRETSPALTEASAQPPRAPAPATIAPQAVGVTTGTWLTRLAHDVLAVQSRLPNSPPDVVSAKFRLILFPPRTSRSSQAYPLLI
jgi:hypothetical protein